MTDISDLDKIAELERQIKIVHDTPDRFIPKFPDNPTKIKRREAPIPADLPLDLLPQPIAGVAKDIRRRLSVPVGFFSLPALQAAGVLIQIRVKGADGFHLLPTIWAIVSAQSGSMKSAPSGQAIRPLQMLEQQWGLEHAEALKQNEQAEILWDAEQKRMKKEVERGSHNSAELAERLVNGAPEKPIRRRILISDCTPEKTALLLLDNPGGLLAWTDEFAQRLDSGGKKGREDQHALDLASFEASGSYSVDRVGRPSLVVPSPRLAVGGTIQPPVLRNFIDQARSDGYFERFVFLTYSTLPTYEPSDYPKDHGAEAEYQAAIMRLAYLDPVEIGAQEHDKGGFWFIPLDREAKELFRDWITFIERAIRLPIWEGRDRVSSWFGKCRSLVLKLALITHLLECQRGAIQKRTLERAISLTLVFYQHAEAVLSGGVMDPPKPAELLIEFLLEEQAETFTARGVYRRHREGLEQEAVERAIGELLERGWIAEEKAVSNGRPASKFHVNPRLFKESAFESVRSFAFNEAFSDVLSSEILDRYSISIV